MMYAYSENGQLVANRKETYKLLSYFFLALLDKEFTAKLLALKLDELLSIEGLPEDVSKGMKKIQSFILNSKVKPIEKVLLELSVDRTQLLRGLNAGNGPRPPYESVYLNRSPQDVLVELGKFYGSANYELGLGICESPEQIGVQLSFMGELCGKQEKALAQEGKKQSLKKILKLQQTFLDQHLGKWYFLYADEMLRYARTDFYKGVALLLRGFVENDIIYLQKVAA